MASKVIILVVLIAAVKSQNIVGNNNIPPRPPSISNIQQYSSLQNQDINRHVIPITVPVTQTRIEPYDPNPQYVYSYDVNDYHTGDSKSHTETRHGDVVQGQYSLTDPDGSRRTVDYRSDPQNGFNAFVQRTSQRVTNGNGRPN